MPSDMILGSMIIGGSISMSIWWAQRNRKIEYGGTTHLGRSDDKVINLLQEIKSNIEKLNKRS